MKMNKIIAFSLASLLSMPAFASDQCIQIAKIAQLVMEIRQQNTPITELLSGVENPASIKGMAILAYQQPLQKLDSQKQKAIVDFGSLFFIMCSKDEPEGISL
jgi:hypothetical protein